MAQASLNSNPRDWRTRLRGDPGNWLLDAADNPSVYFWFQRDIVGRPADSLALVEAREKIVFSDAVQKIFAAQNAGGYWEHPDQLDAPRYRATLWSLALLAELGVSPQSRRARAACEFVLQNHLQSNGALSGLKDETNAGLLVRALNYFLPGDARLKPAYESLRTRTLAPPARAGVNAESSGLENPRESAFTFAPHASAGARVPEIFALWAIAEMPAEWRTREFHMAVDAGAENILDALARGDYPVFGAFPSFEPRNALLALRVLAMIGKTVDTRAAAVIEKIWERQGESARWRLEKSFNEEMFAAFEPAGVPSKWATLAVLRIVTRLRQEQG
ncbi:MAG: hypothetical protein HY327_08485 [Chloroflexi bacterium]|nr:hypothetical protein [Chloroflexota bacterium]